VLSPWLVVLAGALAAAAVVRALAPSAPPRLGQAVLAVTLLLVVVSQGSAAYDGYDSDTWTYRLIVERVAEGVSLRQNDPFLLHPPPTPHVTPYWYAAGWVARMVPADPLFRLLALGAAALVTYGAWRAAGVLLPEPARPVAVALFWLTNVGTWPEVMLGRNVSVGLTLLTVAAALEARRGWPLWTALGIALAFYAHPFGGVLAAGATGLALLAAGRRPEVKSVVTLVVLAAALIGPVAYHTMAEAPDAGPSSAHVVRPGVAEVGGWRALSAVEALRLLPPSLLLLLLGGLLVPRDAETQRARRLVGAGLLLVAVSLFTPVYHYASAAVGGWLIERTVALAFPWVAASLALLTLARRGVAFRVAAGLLSFGVATNALLVFTESFLDRPFRAAAWIEAAVRPTPRAERRDRRLHLFYRYGREAQAEAASLRALLAHRTFVSEPLLAYGFAGVSLGVPVAVPPGHAAPTPEFMRRERRVRAVIDGGTWPGWSMLLAEATDLQFLVTPAPGAEMEEQLWSGRRGRTSPAETRRLLQEAKAIETAFTGRFFVVDRFVVPR
jgi:hypothetical protein